MIYAVWFIALCVFGLVYIIENIYNVLKKKTCTEEERNILDEIAKISDEKLLSWIQRGFITVEPLAHAVLKFRKKKQ